MRKLALFSYIAYLACGLGAQQNRLNETILLNIHSIWFGQAVEILILNNACFILRPGPEVLQLVPSTTQLSTKFILLINVKMTMIVSI